MLDRLAIGSIGSAYSKKYLTDAGITHVLCLCDERVSRFAFPDEFVYERVAFEDKPEAAESFRCEHLDRCLTFIHMAMESSPANKVLVHCYQGKSRSCAVCVAFLMFRDRYGEEDKRDRDGDAMTLAQAFENVRRVRPQAEMNTGLWAVLKGMEREKDRRDRGRGGELVIEGEMASPATVFAKVERAAEEVVEGIIEGERLGDLKQDEEEDLVADYLRELQEEESERQLEEEREFARSERMEQKEKYKWTLDS